MAYNGLIASGFGGQGVMLFGQLLSYSAMLDNKFTTWLPSYGPEMRGGTANCTVVLSDEYIASPVLDRPTEIVVFNLPSLTKFEDSVKENGIILINSSVVEAEVSRKDVTVYKVPANDIAEKLGNPKVQNVVMLGAYIGATGAISVEAVKHALEHKLAGKKQQLIELNFKALEEGINAVKK